MNLEAINKNTNYAQYLSRMENSVSLSSKGLLPFLVSMHVREGAVLDVGCGSGILMETISKVCPNLSVFGIDMNENAVNECVKKGLNAEKISLKELAWKKGEPRKFQCIIFSSVLHEFSSYDEREPFKPNPILYALCDAENLLSDDGVIIIRDGLKAENSFEKGIMPERISFRSKKDIQWVERFSKEYKAEKFTYDVIRNSVYLPRNIAKEFLFTFTWGEESWEREVKEKFGILSDEEWKDILRLAGFFPITEMYNSEEYIKYLSEKIVITEQIAEMFSRATVTFVAKKRKNIKNNRRQADSVQ